MDDFANVESNHLAQRRLIQLLNAEWIAVFMKNHQFDNLKICSQLV